MRRAEGAPGDESAAAVEARDRVHARDRDRLVVAERRQEGGQPPRDHRLAGAGRAVHEQVVAAGRDDLQRGDERVVAAHVAQVGVLAGVLGTRIGLRDGRGFAVAAGDLDRFLQRRDAEHLERGDERGLACSRHRQQEPAETVARGALGDGQGPARRPQFARERELALHRAAVQRLDRELPARRQHGHGDRQVEAWSGLAQVGGREVDGDALGGKLEARVDHGRAHAVARLADGFVGEPDDRERGQPAADVGLDPHPARLDPVDSERVDAREAQNAPSR